MHTSTITTPVTLVLGEESLQTLKEDLTKSSDYFRAMFTSRMRECRENTLVIQDVDKATMTLLLASSEPGKVTFTPENALHLLTHALRFEMKPLQNQVFDYLKNTLTVDDASDLIDVLEKSASTQAVPSDLIDFLRHVKVAICKKNTSPTIQEHAQNNHQLRELFQHIQRDHEENPELDLQNYWEQIEAASIQVKSVQQLIPIVHIIEDETLRNAVLKTLCESLIRENKLKKAKMVFKFVTNQTAKNTLFKRFSEKYLERNQPKHAFKYANRLSTHIAKLPLFANIINHYIEQNAPQEAITLTHRIADENTRYNQQFTIVNHLLETHHPREALRLATSMDSPHFRDSALHLVIDHCLNETNPSLVEIREMTDLISDLDSKDNAIQKIINHYLQTNDVDNAFEHIELLSSHRNRDKALLSIISHLKECKRYNSAIHYCKQLHDTSLTPIKIHEVLDAYFEPSHTRNTNEQNQKRHAIKKLLSIKRKFATDLQDNKVIKYIRTLVENDSFAIALKVCRFINKSTTRHQMIQIINTTLQELSESCIDENKLAEASRYAELITNRDMRQATNHKIIAAQRATQYRALSASRSAGSLPPVLERTKTMSKAQLRELQEFKEAVRTGNTT